MTKEKKQATIDFLIEELNYIQEQKLKVKNYEMFCQEQLEKLKVELENTTQTQISPTEGTRSPQEQPAGESPTPEA